MTCCLETFLPEGVGELTRNPFSQEVVMGPPSRPSLPEPSRALGPQAVALEAFASAFGRQGKPLCLPVGPEPHPHGRRCWRRMEESF